MSEPHFYHLTIVSADYSLYSSGKSVVLTRCTLQITAAVERIGHEDTPRRGAWKIVADPHMITSTYLS